MRHFAFSVPVICLLSLLVACGGSDNSQIPPPPISVTVVPGTVNLIAGAQQQFTATVHNSSNTAVTWSLSGSGCSGAACGTLSTSGLYTAPTPVPSAIAVSVVATAAADTTKSASATANLVPVIVSISPASASVYQRDMTQFTPTVTGTNDPSLTWTVNGSIGGGCDTGYILLNGMYTTSMCDIFGTPRTFTIVATSNADPTKSATAEVTVTGSSPNNSRMNGEYAYLFRGYDLDGPMAIAGRITIDGSGGMYAGEMGMNRASSTLVMSASGNYSILNDGRGTMYMGCCLFRFAMDSSDTARMLEFDQTMNNPIRGTGEIQEQDTSAFSLNTFNGTYILKLGGDLDGTPIAMLGRVSLDSNGNLQGTLDAALSSGNLGSLPVSGMFDAPSSLLGDGVMSISPTGLPISTPLLFMYFIVSANMAYVVGIDQRSSAVPTLSGLLVKQSGGPFTNAAMNSPTVLQLTGLGSTPGSHVILGQAEFDGVSNVSGISDENFGGQISTATPFTGTYSVDANGRGVANLTIAGDSTSFTFYVVSPGTAFVMAGSPGTSIGEVLTGGIEKQVGAPFTAAEIAGTYAAGSLAPSTNLASSNSAVLTLRADGTLSGTLDVCETSICVLNGGATGTFTLTDADTGRGTADMGQSSGTSVFYVVSPSRILSINGMLTDYQGASLEVLQK